MCDKAQKQDKLWDLPRTKQALASHGAQELDPVPGAMDQPQKPPPLLAGLHRYTASGHKDIVGLEQFTSR
eukprot:28422-Lingulodinium_polyedra.AAC.1